VRGIQALQQFGYAFLLPALSRLAEELITAPVLKNLLSTEAVELALKTIRQLANEDRAALPTGANQALATARTRVAELERLVRDGALSADEAAAPLESAEKERRQAEAVIPEQRAPVTEAQIIWAVGLEHRQAANAANLNNINELCIGSGGVIRNYNHLTCHEIFFDRESLRRHTD
jgi:hypothetical protein